MATKRSPKCALCGKAISDGLCKTYKGKKYHEFCFVTLVEKASKANSDTAKTFDRTTYLSLCNYICKVFELDDVNDLFKKQIEDHKNRYGYSYQTMENDLYYFFEVLGNPNKKGTLGILPYIHDESTAFWERIRKANEANASIKLCEKEEVFQIRLPDCSLSHINIEDL